MQFFGKALPGNLKELQVANACDLATGAYIGHSNCQSCTTWAIPIVRVVQPGVEVSEQP